MGSNYIAEVSGTFTGGGGFNQDTWTLDVDLGDSGVTVIDGDFDAADIDGNSLGTEADDGYVIDNISTTAYGTPTINPVTGEIEFIIDRAAVFASGADQTVTFTVIGSFSGGGSDDDTVTINLIICVARDTVIQTPTGSVAVQNLTPGDLVSTQDGAQAIRWIGARKLSAADLAKDPSLRPIRIRTDAIAPGQPAQDLTVSPQHRLLLQGWQAELFFGQDEVLAPAKNLINDHSIQVDHTCTEVEYFHVMFDRHEVMNTNGLWTESFYPGPTAIDGLAAGTRCEILRLFPNLAEGSNSFGPAHSYSLRRYEAAVMATGMITA